MKKHRKTSKKRIYIKRNKKAQFFLIVAVIIVMIFYTLTANYNWIKETIDPEYLSDYKYTSDMYNRESGATVDWAIFTAPGYCLTDPPEKIINDPKCPPGALAEFSERFVGYAKEGDPNYGLVFAYKMPDGSIIIKNMLGGWLGQEGTNAQTIKIEATRNFGQEKVPIEGDVLFSTQEYTTGTITLNIGSGQFSTTARTKVSNFGQGFSQTVVKGADNIIIKAPFGDIKIPVNKVDLWNGQTTFKTNPEKDQNTIVSVSQI